MRFCLSLNPETVTVRQTTTLASERLQSGQIRGEKCKLAGKVIAWRRASGILHKWHIVESSQLPLRLGGLLRNCRHTESTRPGQDSQGK
jgi:hypothetical protein